MLINEIGLSYYTLPNSLIIYNGGIPQGRVCRNCHGATTLDSTHTSYLTPRCTKSESGENDQVVGRTSQSSPLCLEKARKCMKKWADEKRKPQDYNVVDLVMIKLLPQQFKAFRDLHKGLVRKCE